MASLEVQKFVIAVLVLFITFFFSLLPQFIFLRQKGMKLEEDPRNPRRKTAEIELSEIRREMRMSP
jgi:hypothetical protein